MTVADMLRDMRAASAARKQYQTSADTLNEMARDLERDGWENWPGELRRMARLAQRAARNEYDNGRAA